MPGGGDTGDGGGKGEGGLTFGGTLRGTLAGTLAGALALAGVWDVDVGRGVRRCGRERGEGSRGDLRGERGGGFDGGGVAREDAGEDPSRIVRLPHLLVVADGVEIAPAEAFRVVGFVLIVRALALRGGGVVGHAPEAKLAER